MTASRAARVARGASAAGTATFIALVSHVTGGGQMPGWVGLVLPAVLSLAVCTGLAGRRLSVWRLSVAVVLSQVLFHALFVLGTFTASPDGGQAAPHHSHGAVSTTVASSSSAAAAHLHMDVTMWLMHGVAALLTIAALYRGERALTRLREIAVEMVTWARRRIVVALVAVFAPPVRAVVTACAEPSRPVLAPVVSALTRRGPPALLAV